MKLDTYEQYIRKFEQRSTIPWSAEPVTKHVMGLIHAVGLIGGQLQDEFEGLASEEDSIESMQYYLGELFYHLTLLNQELGLDLERLASISFDAQQRRHGK